MIKGIRHIGIEVKDMGKMINFYESLGLELFWDKIEKPGHTGFEQPVRTVKLRCNDGTIIELVENHKYKNHFALTTIGTNKKVEWIKDPEGNMIEMVNDELL